MKMANEVASFFEGEEEYLSDRKLFVANLGILASQTREQVVSMELDHDDETLQELVIITFRGGAKKMVNVTMDSYAAIVRDVFKQLS